MVDGLLTGIETVFNFLAPYISQIWGSICGFFDSASSTITTIVETIKSVFQGLFDAVSTIFGGISSAVSTAIGTVTSVISGAIDAISGFVDKIGGAISKAKDFVGGIGGKVKSALGFAYGKDRVPYDNYPAILHQGEKVLTRNQADQYERRMSTRGVQLKDVTPIDRDPDDPQDNNGGTGGTGNPQDSDLPKSGGIGSVTIEKLADTVIIEKEADTDNKVRIYDGEGKPQGVVQNDADVKKYGIFQQTYTKEEGKDATTTAKSMFKTVEKTFTLECVNLNEAVTGAGAVVRDSSTGLSGVVWIDADTHTWQNGVATMSLTVTLKQMMDTKEG